MGGPEMKPDTSDSRPRRSLYFRHSEKDRDPFLALFDDASVNECYRRKVTVVPQQALAMANSRLVAHAARDLARVLADRLRARGPSTDREAFIEDAFETVLSRRPTGAEMAACRETLGRVRSVAPENDSGDEREHIFLLQVLLNHNDFLTIR